MRLLERLVAADLPGKIHTGKLIERTRYLRNIHYINHFSGNNATGLIWFAVTPCVYLQSRRVCSLEKCLSLFYYRGVDLSDCSGDFSVLKKKMSCFLPTIRAEGSENWRELLCLKPLDTFGKQYSPRPTLRVSQIIINNKLVKIQAQSVIGVGRK